MKNNPPLKKLRECRQKKNLTIKDMAKILGISSSMYGYIENGDKRLSYEMAVKIADFFEVTPDEMFIKDYEHYFKD